ncbi:MAG: zinc finger Ran-binding domain-containing protein [Nannocystaceae bacterium]
MRTVFRGLQVLVIGAALVIAGCSKSVEGETRKWSSNTAKVTEIATHYPGFKGALDARLGAATAIHDAADKLDGDAKIDKLSEANGALMKGFVGDLAGLDLRLKDLREKRVEVAAQAGDESSRLAAKVAAEDAQKALDRVDAALKAGAADEAAAAVILRKIDDDLDTAESALGKVLAADKKKKDDADAAKKAEADATKKAADDEAAKVAPWKCDHCDSENPHDATQCNSCGAPRPAAKKDEAAK